MQLTAIHFALNKDLSRLRKNQRTLVRLEQQPRYKEDSSPAQPTYNDPTWGAENHCAYNRSTQCKDYGNSKVCDEVHSQKY